MAESTATRSDLARRQSRDQLKHWVAPPSARGKPCPHSCCQNERVHPRNLPVKLNRAYLRSLSGDEVIRELETYQRYNDTHEEGFLQVLAEAGRREESAEKATARKERARDKRQHRESEYRDEVYREWLHAENGIQGAVMLNRTGKAAGIDERSLFTGPESRVNKYASDELKEWFESHPRPTRARIIGKGAERRERMETGIWGYGPEHW
jgi:hypothetical protein